MLKLIFRLLAGILNNCGFTAPRPGKPNRPGRKTEKALPCGAQRLIREIEKITGRKLQFTPPGNAWNTKIDSKYKGSVPLQSGEIGP